MQISRILGLDAWLPNTDPVSAELTRYGSAPAPLTTINGVNYRRSRHSLLEARGGNGRESGLWRYSVGLSADFLLQLRLGWPSVPVRNRKRMPIPHHCRTASLQSPNLVLPSCLSVSTALDREDLRHDRWAKPLVVVLLSSIMLVLSRDIAENTDLRLRIFRRIIQSCYGVRRPSYTCHNYSEILKITYLGLLFSIHSFGDGSLPTGI